eukprot:scaffold115001_cov69-Phaeocystis_antarctica.AAC.7
MSKSDASGSSGSASGSASDPSLMATHKRHTTLIADAELTAATARGGGAETLGTALGAALGAAAATWVGTRTAPVLGRRTRTTGATTAGAAGAAGAAADNVPVVAREAEAAHANERIIGQRRAGRTGQHEARSGGGVEGGGDVGVEAGRVDGEAWHGTLLQHERDLEQAERARRRLEVSEVHLGGGDDARLGRRRLSRRRRRGRDAREG